MSQSTDYLLARCLHRPDASASEVSAAIVTAVVARVGERVPWRPGAREILAELRAAGTPMALVTSAWGPFVDAVLRHLPADTFEVVVGGESVTRTKPDPEPYGTATERLGVRAEDCLAVEDSLPGVASATAAGVPTLGVPHLVPLAPRPGLVVADTLSAVDAARLAFLYRAARAARK